VEAYFGLGCVFNSGHSPVGLEGGGYMSCFYFVGKVRIFEREKEKK
jgi:hypothetical protein